MQIKHTIPLGNDGIGMGRLANWKEAALRAMYNNPKLFNAWVRAVLDAEAAKILKKHKKIEQS